MGEDLDELAKSIDEGFRRSELSNVSKWIEDHEAYYEKYPNEIIRAHILLKAMRAVQDDMSQSKLKGSK